jgi:hypothetical protein
MKRMTVLLVAALLAGPALADAAGLRTALERVQDHRRVAAAYLRTGNVDMALIELEKLQAALAALAPEPGLQGTGASSAGVLAAVRAGIETSLLSAEKGELERASLRLDEAGRSLDGWRRDAGIALFSDCIAEIGGAYERLDRHRTTRPDLSDSAVRDGIREESVRTRRALDRCDSEAPGALRSEGEFRRLVDGFATSLDLVPDALAKQDADYLHRLLIEQRSFERLLAFRFG